MNYTLKLDAAIASRKSHVVVGLDPELEKIPEFFHHYANPVLEFNKMIINATKDNVAGYKLNMAFYEYLEEKGIEAIRGSLAAIPPELITICDAKRGDLGNTSQLYAKTYFDKYGFDSITVNAYMGKDSLEPFFERTGKLVYILALTSNETSKEFQHTLCEGKKLYEKIVETSLEWKQTDKTGFVFGANYVDELNIFTSNNPNVPLLIPGIGAQGNELAPLVKNLKSKRYLINSSRSIIYSAKKDCSESEFVKAVSDSVESLNAEIREESNS